MWEIIVSLHQNLIKKLNLNMEEEIVEVGEKRKKVKH